MLPFCHNARRFRCLQNQRASVRRSVVIVSRVLVTLALNHANEFDTFGPSPNIAGTEAKTVQDLNEYYRGWRYLVGSIASKYDLWSATAQLSTEQNSRLDLLSFPTGKEVMPIMQNPQFDIHDGDFSFSTDVLLESLPAACAEWVVATDPGSWRLSLVPAATEGFIEVRLMMVSTKSIWFEDLYTPGDVLTLSHEVACSGQC